LRCGDQLEFQEDGARHRIGSVGADFLESQRAIECHSGLHFVCYRVETHELVADEAGLGDDGFGEAAAEFQPAKFGTNVEALHFADAGLKRTKGHASGGLAIDFGEQQASARGRVLAGKRGVFLVEALEAEAEAERLSVLDEKLACGFDFGVGGDGQNGDLLLGSFRQIGGDGNGDGHDCLLHFLVGSGDRLGSDRRLGMRTLCWMTAAAHTIHNRAHGDGDGGSENEEQDAVRHWNDWILFIGYCLLVVKCFGAFRSQHKDARQKQVPRALRALVMTSKDYPINNPPLTLSTWPVMYDASSLARKQTALATSVSCPTRPSGTNFSICSRSSGVSSRVMAVSM